MAPESEPECALSDTGPLFLLLFIFNLKVTPEFSRDFSVGD